MLLELAMAGALAGTFQIPAGEAVPHPMVTAEVVIVGVVGTPTFRKDPVTLGANGAIASGGVTQAYYPVRIEETLKGEATGEVQVRVPPAAYDALVAGNRVLIHLMKHPADPGSLTPVGDYGIFVRTETTSCEAVAVVGASAVVGEYPDDGATVPVFHTPSIDMVPGEGRMVNAPATDEDLCSGMGWNDVLRNARNAAARLE